jgi:hypothetical protein
MPAKSVFISHSWKDDGFVRELRQALEGLGVETWADSERLAGGHSLTTGIQTAVEHADHFLVIVSLDALNSEWVQREVKYAQSVRKKIIPLMRPGIGGPILKLLQLPTRIIRQAQAQLAPVADLVLELEDPVILELDGQRRATATATLTYIPADGSPKVDSPRFHFTAPLGPIEAEEISWYLERYINWPSGLFEERAKLVTEALTPRGFCCASSAVQKARITRNRRKLINVRIRLSYPTETPQWLRLWLAAISPLSLRPPRQPFPEHGRPRGFPLSRNCLRGRHTRKSGWAWTRT